MMKRLLALLLLVLLGLSFLSVCVRAQDDDESEADAAGAPGGAGQAGQQGGAAGAGAKAGEADDEEDDKADVEGEEAAVVLKPSPDVITTFIFPEFPDSDFQIGEKVTLLISFHNTGTTAFNITSVQAHLHSPFDYNYYIQNFTAREVGATVEPKSQVSVEYVFQPDKSLEPIEYHLSAYLEYNDTVGGQFRSFVTNGTVELVEKPSSFDAKQFFSYAMLIGAVALLGYIAYSLGHPAAKKSKRSSVERGTRSNAAANQDEWAGPIYTPKSSSTAIKKKSTKSKAS
jgi:hypothetical protein